MKKITIVYENEQNEQINKDQIHYLNSGYSVLKLEGNLSKMTATFSKP